VLRSNKEWDQGWVVEEVNDTGELLVWKLAVTDKLTKTIAKQNIPSLVRPETVSTIFDGNTDKTVCWSGKNLEFSGI
jgi:hypothetical protein